MEKDEQMDDPVARTETKFASLAAINDPVSESMQPPVFVSSLSCLTEYAAITAFMNTKKADISIIIMSQ